MLAALKMQHVIIAAQSGVVVALGPAPGATVRCEEIPALLEPRDDVDIAAMAAAAGDLDVMRPELAALFERRRRMSDAGRPAPEARRHARGLRGARETIADLLDEGGFREYGSFVPAPQRARRPYDVSPAKGLIMARGEVNGDLFDAAGPRAAVIACHRGVMNHDMTDRTPKRVEKRRTPLILLAESGGGRPRDRVFSGPAGLELMTFRSFARLSGLVPAVGVTNRFRFAGDVARPGMCDVVIAARASDIGMGGRSMIEGGGAAMSRRPASALRTCGAATASSTFASPRRPRRWRPRAAAFRRSRPADGRRPPPSARRRPREPPAGARTARSDRAAPRLRAGAASPRRPGSREG